MKNTLSVITAVLLLLIFAACSQSESGDAATSKTILVTGATGTQGGAVARELLARGFNVRGLTRNPNSEKAQLLTELGVTVVKGDYDDARSLAAAMQGVHGVFGVTIWGPYGTEKEVEHGRQLIDAAKLARVEHFVFTSVAEAETQTGIPHFDSKYEVEKILYDSGLNYSIVRPVEFMNNIHYTKETVMGGVLTDPRDSSKRHQWIAARDIGFFVGEMFDNPDKWIGQSINIAGDEMTIAEYAQVLSECLNVDVEYQKMSWEVFEQTLGEEMTSMYRWFDDPGYQVDIAALRKEYPNLTSMEDYLNGLGWSAR
jgi:uncharacterized protein YbjT (DUF2867 family)